MAWRTTELHKQGSNAASPGAGLPGGAADHSLLHTQRQESLAKTQRKKSTIILAKFA